MFLVAGNWKMNNLSSETANWIEKLNDVELDNDVLVFIPSVYLTLALYKNKNSKLKIGIQNMHAADSGAFTGEISSLMVKDIGIEYALIGHSERREYFSETDEQVNLKLLAALEHNIKPVLCIGEILLERKAKQTNEVLERQLKIALQNVEDASKVIIAYEPVWAIGTGHSATSEEANDACKFIRSVVAKLYNDEIAKNTIIQYGGSVNESTISELAAQSDINGVLVGGASLDAEQFIKIIKGAK